MSTTLKAEFVRDIWTNIKTPPRHSSRKLWTVDGKFIITSAVNSKEGTVHETYVFYGDQDGNILDHSELHGSYNGGLDHQRAIDGYVAALQEGQE